MFPVSTSSPDARPTDLGPDSSTEVHFLIYFLALLLFQLTEREARTACTADLPAETLRDLCIMGSAGCGICLYRFDRRAPDALWVYTQPSGHNQGNDETKL